MIAPIQIRPPEHWQDFELLCKKLWGEIWNCSDTIKRNGRSGQKQYGVDIYGIPNGGVEYYGIQCKGKDNYTHAQLTPKEIDEEVRKAQSFKPALKAFYFATTAVKDAAIEEYIRKKNVENITSGGFSIDIFSWEDIVDLLKERRSTYSWYINNCQYADNSDVRVLLNDSQTEITIKPQYYIYSKNHKKPQKSNSERNALSWNFTLPRSTYDCTWCKVNVTVENIGSTIISDYMISLQISSSENFELDDARGDKRKSGIAVITGIARYMLEVFVHEKYNIIEYRPRANRLVQTDRHTLGFWIHPSKLEQHFDLIWTVKSADYSKSDKLSIISIAELIPKYDGVIDENNIDDIYIEPKIIED